MTSTRASRTPPGRVPPPNSASTAPNVMRVLPDPLHDMTKMLRLIKRYRKARARWTPKRLELGAIPA
jgi:hypothetical protein